MLFSNTYNQLKNNSKGIYKIKGSKFIAYATIVKSEEQVLNEINKIKKLEKKLLNVVLLTNLEFFDNKKSGPKPISTTKKYLINITGL